MAVYASGNYTPKNPNKYIGKMPIRYRSSWEFAAMTTFDNHPNIIGWASESISIPYYNPILKKMSMYIPDFLLIYIDKSQKKHCELIEVKPLKELPTYTGTINYKTKLTQVINAAKWKAAVAFCAKRNWYFRVATEQEMFSFNRKHK